MGQAFWQLDWVWIATAWVLGITCALLLLWALFADRPRDRRRCPKCWYDMTGISGLRCPECGHEAKNERRLAKTRRRWGWSLLAAVVLLAVYPVAHVPRIASAGPSGALPTTALIEWVARNEPPEVYANGKMSPPTPAAADLARRASAGELWGWQWQILIRRLHILRWRDRWPAGLPWEVAFNQPSWLRPAQLQINLPDHLSYLPSYPPNSTTRVTKLVPIGLPTKTAVLPKEANSVVVSLSAPNWKGSMTLPVRQVPRAEDAMTLVSNTAVDAQVRRALQSSISPDKNAATSTNLMLGARLYREKGPLPNDLAVGLSVELRRDGIPVKSWPLHLIDSAFGPPVDWVRINMPDPGWDKSDPQDMKRWTARIRGDPAVALGDARRERCWSGEYTIPLSEYLH